MGLINIDQFISNERAYRHCFIETYMAPVIDKYRLIKGASGWIGTDRVPDVQNTDTTAYSKSVCTRNIRDLIDHMYTFESIDGHIYWAAMPYSDESVEKIRNRLMLNGIRPLEVMPYSPYADVMILFDSNDVMLAY